MKVLLFIFGAIAFLGGLLMLTHASTPVYEIEAFIVLLISAVLASGAAIVEALDIISKKLDAPVGASDELRSESHG